MPSPNDEVIKPPFLKGLDLTNDARISNPGSCKELYNIFMRAPGVYSVRPGSATMASTIIAPATAPTLVVVAGVSATKWNPIYVTGKEAVVFLDAVKASVPDKSLQKGINPLWPDIALNNKIPVDTSFPVITANTSAGAGNYINGLTRVFLQSGNKSYWIGAVRRPTGSGNDCFWWFKESTGQLVAIPLNDGYVNGSGEDWTFLPTSSNKANAGGPQAWAKGIIAFATNGAGRPIGFFGSGLDEPFSAGPMSIRSDAEISGSSVANHDMVNIQSMCMYGGQVCIGGFGLYAQGAAGNDDYRDYANCFAFIDVDEIDGGMKIASIGSPAQDSFELAGDSTHLYFIRVGDDLSERIRAVTPVASLIDTKGISGGLAIFTDKRVAIYANPPPVGGTPNGSDFHVVAMGDVGCTAVKSIARTPHGVVFLGTDGLFYLIGLDNTIRPISRAIAPLFQGLSPRVFRKVCAVYDGEFYKVFFPQRPQDRKQNRYSPVPGSGEMFKPALNTEHLYADMRYLSNQEKDLGVIWSGKHDGLNVSCVYRATDAEDYGVVAAGMGHTVGLVQLNRYDLRTDPAMNNLAAGTRRFPWRMVSGDYDDGDMHVDKSISALRVGVRTNADITLTMGMVAYGDVVQQSKGYKADVSVVALGTALDPGPVANGVEPFQSEQSINLPVLLPPEVLRGRVFEFSIEEKTPTNNARPSFSDIELTIKRTDTRRSTG